MSAEPHDFTKILGKWLPVAGNWSVCWRTTRDGNKSEIFHKRCDSKVPTLTVVKVLNNKKSLIFGGYTTAKWAGEGPLSAPGSFLFSFRNNDNLPPFKSPFYDTTETNAIFPKANTGPRFGIGPDLALNYVMVDPVKNIVVNVAKLGGSYQPPCGNTKSESKTESLLAGSLYFTPAEVEVLYLN